MSRVPAVLTLALAVNLVGCSGAPDTLSIVTGPPPANQTVAALLARTSEEAHTPIRLTQGPSVENADAALAALENGAADLAIVLNSSQYRQEAVRTVVPLYPSVLHIGVRPEKVGRPFRETLDGATVFAGGEGSPARYLLGNVTSMFALSDLEFSYVDNLDDGADIIFVFAPISPQLEPFLAGYELYSLGRAADVGAGTLADGLSLVAPLLRPFVIPEGTYGEFTRTAILTVAIDTLLVTAADTPPVAIYDLVQSINIMGPRLVAQRPDLKVDNLEGYDISRLTFPVHEGALAYRARNEPGFYERLAGIFEAAVTAVAAIGTILFALVGYLRGLKKARIDELYAEALAIRAQSAEELSAEQRLECGTRLRALADRAFKLLMEDKLAANESFRILQALIRDVLQEIENPSRPTRPAD